MTDRSLTDEERDALWRRAANRLALVDTEPPVSLDEVDAVLKIVGPRPSGSSLSAWLSTGAVANETEAPSAPSSDNVTSLSDYRQRFKPVAAFVRLAADSAGSEIGLPSRPLETDDGQFRLSAIADADGLRIEIQALGMASTDWAGRRMGLSGAEDDQPLIAIFTFDEDGDATLLLDDTTENRKALLRPMIGAIDEA